MNDNEVISNRACEILGNELGSKEIHPKDHSNFSQFSNDIFSSVMQMTTFLEVTIMFFSKLAALAKVLDSKRVEFNDIVKIDRTHTQTATSRIWAKSSLVECIR